jgi:hypothetical protein
MLRGAFNALMKAVLFGGLVAAGTVGIYYYQGHNVTAYQIQKLEDQKHRLEEQKQKLEADKQKLETVVTRLSDEKRVAEVIVTDQKLAQKLAVERSPGGVLQTSLLFVEYARDGSSLAPRHFTIDGNVAHIDAMVIKFDRGLVAENDALRGRSIALFCRLYGDAQAPDQGFRIDEPGVVPDIYRGPAQETAAVAAFEKELWQNFWRLAEDKDYRAQKGVRVANGQGIWGPFAPDRIYTIMLDSDGGLNLASEPMKGIYQEAMKRRPQP